MIKYEYKKVKGHDQKKFIENGHTMFETDVLRRLKRLSYLEDERNKLEFNDSTGENLTMGNITVYPKDLDGDLDLEINGIENTYLNKVQALRLASYILNSYKE